MRYLLLADLTVAIHALFVLFVVCGGLAALRWPRVVRLHLPAAIWGVAIELAGWICPLTHLENRFRRLAGEAGYGETFIEHYLMPLLYPPGLSRHAQALLGMAVLVVNVAVYISLWRRGTFRRGNG